MKIDEAQLQLSMQKFYVLGKDYEAVQVAINTMNKYQKIQKIIDDWEDGTLEEKDSIYAFHKIKEIVEDGNTN